MVHAKDCVCISTKRCMYNEDVDNCFYKDAVWKTIGKQNNG